MSKPPTLPTILALLMLFLYVQTATAQMGFTLQQRISQDNFTSDDHPNGDLLQNGYELSINYRITFRKIKLTLNPGAFYGAYHGTDGGIAANTIRLPINYQVEDYGAQLELVLYPFDFKYQNEEQKSVVVFLARNFFLSTKVGGGTSASEAAPLDGSVERRRFRQFSGNAGGGLGLDLPMGKRVLLTPVLNYRTYFTPADMARYYNLRPIDDIVVPRVERSEWTFGLRLGFDIG